MPAGIAACSTKWSPVPAVGGADVAAEDDADPDPDPDAAVASAATSEDAAGGAESGMPRGAAELRWGVQVQVSPQPEFEASSIVPDYAGGVASPASYSGAGAGAAGRAVGASCASLSTA